MQKPQTLIAFGRQHIKNLVTSLSCLKHFCINRNLLVRQHSIISFSFMNCKTFALAAASVHCLYGLALSCIITLKSFSSSVYLILLLSISYSNLQFLLPTCMTAHLSMLNGMFQSFDHLCSLSINLP